MVTAIVTILFICCAWAVPFGIAAPMLQTEVTKPNCPEDINNVKKNLKFLKITPSVYAVIFLVLLILSLFL